MFAEFFEKLSEIPSGFLEVIEGFEENPMSIVLVVLFLVSGIVVFRFSKVKFTTKMLAHMALAVAISVVLNMFVLFRMPQGGSVTLASMVPIFIISFVYGANAGMLTGIIFGILNLILGGVIAHPVQVLLDYPIPFMFVGLAGFLPRHMNLGMTVATLFRFLSHVVSGYVFFAEYAPEGMNPLLYSMVYNGSFLLADFAIALLVMNFIPMNRIAKAIKGEDLALRYW